VRVLYISYTGLAEPLGRSQVLPYIQGLARRGHEFIVLSFEKTRASTHMSVNEVRDLLPQGVRWIPLVYHKSPTIPATCFDVATGIRRGVAAPRIDLIHARSTVPALMAQALAVMKRCPWIFDVRGFLAQEYIDAGHWKPDGLLARTVARAERVLISRAPGVVFLTRRARESCAEVSGRTSAVIPCAVDLSRFQRDDAAGRAVRDRYGLGQGRIMVYAGSLGSWYLAEQMLDFLLVARTRFPGLRSLVLTPHPALISAAAERRGLRDDVIAVSVPPAEIPAHLSAGDFGISFIAPSPSKAASSPTKIAEYLACGLPVVSNSGIGDVRLQADNAPWVVVDSFTAAGYRAVANDLAGLLAQPNIRADARLAAERHFSLDAAVDCYDQLYHTVVSGLPL
jgi:glycosyltransferase involved in cell wall biosynthesis